MNFILLRFNMYKIYSCRHEQYNMFVKNNLKREKAPHQASSILTEYPNKIKWVQKDPKKTNIQVSNGTIMERLHLFFHGG